MAVVYQRPGMFDRLGQGVGGMFEGVRGWSQPRSNRLMLTGMGMLSGRNGEGWEGAMKGLVAGSALDTENKRERALGALLNDPNSTLGDLPAADRAFIAGNPDVAGGLMAARLKPADYGDKYTGYQLAKAEGYTGGWVDYQKEFKDSGVTIDMGGYKLPPGYRPKDPGNPDAGVEPIPGGPAEELPAELAARIGLADSFIGEVPALRERIIGGEATGPVDVTQAGWNSSSTQAEVRRKVLSGIDAMKRMLSGAGLPVAEQAEYEYRYLPGYTDDAKSAAQKLDQLAAELANVKKTVMRGRGGTGEPTDDDPLGLR